MDDFTEIQLSLTGALSRPSVVPGLAVPAAGRRAQATALPLRPPLLPAEE